eukprot:4299389-Prymnesium_polylepis.1
MHPSSIGAHTCVSPESAATRGSPTTSSSPSPEMTTVSHRMIVAKPAGGADTGGRTRLTHHTRPQGRRQPHSRHCRGSFAARPKHSSHSTAGEAAVVASATASDRSHANPARHLRGRVQWAVVQFELQRESTQ